MPCTGSSDSQFVLLKSEKHCMRFLTFIKRVSIQSREMRSRGPFNNPYPNDWICPHISLYKLSMLQGEPCRNTWELRREPVMKQGCFESLHWHTAFLSWIYGCMIVTVRLMAAVNNIWAVSYFGPTFVTTSCHGSKTDSGAGW